MKGDFSRFTFDPRRHYDRVLMQQGRVQLDSDWNEQAEAIAYRYRTALSDILGYAGAPRGNAGFGLRAHSGLTFDGTHHFEVREGLSQRIDGPYSIDAWIKLADGGGGTILYRPGHGSDGGFRLAILNGQLYFDREAGESQQPRYHIVGTNILPANRFVHLAVVCEDGRLSLFVEGALDADLRCTGGMPFDTLPLLIGCHLVDGHPVNHFRGVLDRLRLWRRGLSAADICQLRNGEVPEDDAGLLCDWRFSLDAKGELRDHGRRSHHGRFGYADRSDFPASAKPELWIGAGNYYIDGILNQNERVVRYEDQEDCPGLSLDDMSSHNGSYLAYLNSWDRVVTPIEDASLRETVLGGADTTLRTRIVSQVRLWPLPENAAPLLPLAPEPGSLRVSRAAEMPLQENHLYRVEIHQGGFAAGAPFQLNGNNQGLEVIGIEAAVTSECVLVIREPPVADTLCLQDRTIELVHPAFASISGTVTGSTWERPGVIRLTLRLDASFAVGPGSDGWRLRPIATFKWSEDNGAWAFAVVNIEGNIVTLSTPNGMGSVLRIGDWVEITDDDTILRDMATPLRQIVGIGDGEGTTLRLELDQPLADPWARDHASRLSRHPLLRRWDSVGASQDTGSQAMEEPRSGCRSIRMGEKVLLDGGVQIEFSAGGYATQDYWVIPLRRIVEWPADREGPLFLTPQGPMRRRTELAQLWNVNGRIEIHDLRKLLSPLNTGGPLGNIGPELEKIRAATGRLVRTELAVQELWVTVRDLARGKEAGILFKDMPILGPEPPSELVSSDIPPDHGLAKEACILRRNTQAPSGWCNTGVRIVRFRPDATWVRHVAEMPFAGPVRTAGFAHRIYCLWPSGAFYAFDPQVGADAWTPCRSLPRAELTSVALVATQHMLHVLAISRADGDPRSVNLRYDPGTDTWDELAPMPTLREGFAVAAMTGALVAAGGCKPGTTRPLGTVEMFLPAKNRWKALPSLPKPVRGGVAGTAGGRVYVFGGIGRSWFGFRRRLMDAVQAYSPATETWMLEAPLTVARSGALAVGDENHLYVIGGECKQDRFAAIELLDTMKDRWREAPQPWRRRQNCGAAIVDGILYLLGGSGGAAADSSIEACRVEDVFYIYEKAKNNA